ncbi:MAG: WYL domain-containing protein, partial [Bacillota bacterium]|nr:WYL domain-containing protein [Bacillota bacterium]
MNNVGNAIHMLVLLKSRGKLKISELAELLEVDKRQIRRYKDALDVAQINIKSESGRYGGYSLESDAYLVGLNINDEEFNSLLIANEQLANHPVSKDLNFLIDKIKVLYKESQNKSLSDMYMFKGTKENVDRMEQQKKYFDFWAAIVSKNKVWMDYASLSGEKGRVIRPYAFYQYRGDTYFAAFCEVRNEVRDFKLSRVRSYKVLEEGFEVPRDFDLRDFMKDCIGNHKGEQLEVCLKIQFPMSQIVREKVWVE